METLAIISEHQATHSEQKNNMKLPYTYSVPMINIVIPNLTLKI